MKYTFPVIKTIDDVLHAVDENYFMIAKRDGHTVINYLFASPETFPDVTDEISALRREFRGLIFNDEGLLIRRPLHKFFNVGERSETQLLNMDISQPHVIMDKLDGSMIAPFIVNDRLIWGTKMGDTEVAKQVHEFLENHPDKKHYESFARDNIEDGFTPIFEWTSRAQRIVLDYPEDKLVLTALRDMETGAYQDWNKIQDYSNYLDDLGFKLNVCPVTSGALNPYFLNIVKAMSDVEGFVVRFDDGHMTKIKCDWYCMLHRVKEDISYEKGVVELLINEKMDDIKSMLPESDLKMIEEYEAAFWKSYQDNLSTLLHRCLLNEGDRDLTKKRIALEIVPNYPKWMGHIMFSMLGNQPNPDNIKAMMNDFIIKHCNKNVKFEELRASSLFDGVPVWRERIMNA